MDFPKPSVGQIVQYTPVKTGQVKANNKSQPYPAVITHVWSDTCVNLSVMGDVSFPFVGDRHPTSVGLDLDGGPRSWKWPPRV